jgi:uracil-DNA glycosylase family 4
VDRCALCPGDHSCVPPDGPEDSSYVFLGEGPGWEEDKKGHPFQGKTGREVNEHYLPIVGIPRHTARFANAMGCMPKGQHGKMDMKKDAHRELAQCCFNTHIGQELQCNHYSRKLIVAMGAFANYVLDPDIDLDLHHGIPLQTKWGVVFPMFHPAGGLHEPKKMLHIRTDWVRLKKYLAGKLIVPEDEYAGYEDYREVKRVSDIHNSLRGRLDGELANDTETTRTRAPFCLTYSVEPGTGYLIRAERLDLLEVFQSYLEKWRGRLLWHNWLFDGAVVKKMGLVYPRKLIVDTMVRVFHLGNLPQGLKALAYRELGMEMKDFDDLVTPYAIHRVLSYYNDMYMEEWEKPPSSLVRDAEGNFKLYQPHSMKTKLKVFFTYWQKAQEKGQVKDVFEAWDNWEDSHQLIQEKMGRPYPGKCISYAWEENREETIRYACRDADSLLRLYLILERMKRQVRRKPQELWR